MRTNGTGFLAKTMAVARIQSLGRSFYLHDRVILLVKLFCGAIALSSSVVVAGQPPEIVAQGFDIAAPRKGIIGQFARVRIRVEAPERIRELRIKERSYEVDLAKTLERSNLQLFGLDKRARRHRDLTLNFQNYLNTKLEHDGDYELVIQVIDEEGQSRSAVLWIRARSEETPAREQDPPLETGKFTLERVGSGFVTGTIDFGVEWKTIESERVTIRLKRRAGGATFLSRFAQGDYDEIISGNMLTDRIKNAGNVDSIDLMTARNAASGEVIAVVHESKGYLLSINISKTEISKAGTIVTLIGEYKKVEGITSNSLEESIRDE